jgi:two-component system, OmpR family, response regulator
MLAPVEVARPRRAAPVEVGLPVALVPWPRPEAEAARRRLAARGRSRLLVVDDGAPPPWCTDPLEDWVRASADPDEHARRTATLARRHDQRGGVVVGDAEVTRHGGHVRLTSRQIALVGQLAAEFDRPVAFAVLTRAAAAGGRPVTPSGLVSALARLDRRLAPLALAVVVVRGAAVLTATEVYEPARVRKCSGNTSA